MRILILMFACLAVQQTIAQKYNSKDTCTWVEPLVTSAVNHFDGVLGTRMISYYNASEGGVVNFNQEYASNRWRWPGTDPNFMIVSTAPDDKAQTITLVSPFPAVDTKDKAYAQLKRLYNQVTPCTIMPVAGQSAQLKGTIPPLASSIGTKKIMDAVFTVSGIKKRVSVWLAIKQVEVNRWRAEMRTTLTFKNEELAALRCSYVQEIVNQAKTNFSGQYGKQLSSSNYPMGDVVSESKIYEVFQRFPGSSGSNIEYNPIKKKGKIGLETWKFKAWFMADSFEQAVDKWKKLHAQLNNCDITSPQGRKIKLTGAYKEPRQDKEDFIDYATHTETEKFYISIKFMKDEDGYFVLLSISTMTGN